MKTHSPLYICLLNGVVYSLTRGLVLALWVVTFQYGLEPRLRSAFQDIAAHLASAL